MKKRFLSILLAMVMAFSILPTASLAAGSVEEALGEIDIYNGGQELSYLMINGRVRTLIYTYYNYVNAKGEIKEIPAYCVNPNTTGVPQTVDVGESIEYLAEEKTSDPKVLGIVPMDIRLVRWKNWALRINTKAITRLKWRCGVISSVIGISTTSRSIRRSVAWNCSAHRRCSLRQRTSMPAAQHGMKSCPLK